MTEHQVDFQHLYAQRDKIHPRSFKGFFRNLRLIGGGFFAGLYFLTVWLSWDGRQAVWFDLPERQFYIFGLTFWPSDMVLLAGLLIMAAFVLFIMTVIVGRIWCGYLCPQTVWSWAFIWVERHIEGDRLQRMKLDQAPLNAAKIKKKVSKHFIWLGMGFWTGLTFVGYFTPIRQLLPDVLTLNIGGWALFWIGFFTLATYLNAGWLREQVCLYMCPYARFQGVMYDKDTLVVSYDVERGEPRGGRSRHVDEKAAGLGDCIDCHFCVQVCPTGIDIRDGLQYDCIDCGACVDACNDIMAKVNKPQGLIRYTTQRALEGGKTRWLRPRLIAYTGVLLIMVIGFSSALWVRQPVQLEAQRERQSLYRTLADGSIANVFTLRIANKSQRVQRYQLTVTGLAGLQWQGMRQVEVKPGELRSVAIELTWPAQQLRSGGHEILFTARSLQDEGVFSRTDSRFIAP